MKVGWIKPQGSSAVDFVNWVGMHRGMIFIVLMLN